MSELRPTYGVDSLAAVLPAASAVLGHGQDRTAVKADAARRHLGLPTARRVCVVLVDGLGVQNLNDFADHAPFLASMGVDTAELTTSFPSTTAAALGTFGTGTCPGRTAMVGYTQRNPRTGRMATMVSWEGAEEPALLQRETTVFEDLARDGVRVTSVGSRRFADSGMTTAALRGPVYSPAETPGERINATLDALLAPGLTYLYWGDLDKAGHASGCRSEQWRDALAELDKALTSLVRYAPADTLVLVTADHGMIDADPAARLDIATTPALRAGVRSVGGESRALHLYTGEPEDVAARWMDVLGDSALILGKEKAISAGLFGARVRPHARAAIGDVVVALRGRATVVDSRVQSPAAMGLIGVHGSLTETEMRVPLLVAGP